MPADPKSAKKTDGWTVFFALLESAGIKASCKTLMKLTPGGFPGFDDFRDTE